MASKLCDSCKSANAYLFCRADSAFLCVSCDGKIHAANKLACRHARVCLCEVCEQAPAHVTCKADAAALCVTCDRDIHSANPLARRHERVPVTPFYDFPVAGLAKSTGGGNFIDDRLLSDVDGDDVSREEAEAASWLLPNPNPNPNPAKAGVDNPYLLSDMEPYLDLDYPAVDPKMEAPDNSSGTDGVVPVQNYYNFDISVSKSYPQGFNCISQAVSSSSLDVGVVPDGGSIAEISNPYSRSGSALTEMTHQTMVPVVQLSSAEREARVLRYREKRKNRKFEKTIRYASRKAYAEMRPRIKGRFAKRTDAGANVGDVNIYGGFGVVPTF